MEVGDGCNFNGYRPFHNFLCPFAWTNAAKMEVNVRENKL